MQALSKAYMPSLSCRSRAMQNMQTAIDEGALSGTFHGVSNITSSSRVFDVLSERCDAWFESNPILAENELKVLRSLGA